ncbi:MAG TPA: DUF4837 family protein, partial [Bacteroidales bacterium]|nr:DUF4837 family protein [Bacteroidales bacterium]
MRRARRPPGSGWQHQAPILSHFHTCFLFGIICLVFFLGACKQKSAPPRKEDSSGATLEILTVTDNKEQWEGSLGDTVRNFFGQIQSTLPQPEPLFALANLEVTGFSKMFQHHHNILILSVDQRIQESLIETRKDLWAEPQRVIKVTAPAYQQLIAVVDSHKVVFRDLFLETEYTRTTKTDKILPETKL